MVTIPDRFLDLLAGNKGLAHLATIMPNGSPHLTPVWFDWVDAKIRVNTVRGRVKARNMGRDARVALSIVDPDNFARYIQIRGRVTCVTEDGAVAHNNLLTKKYTGMDLYPWDRAGDVHVLYEIEPLFVDTLG